MQKKRVLSVALILLFMTATIVGVNLSASADATGSFLPNDVTGEDVTGEDESDYSDKVAYGYCGANGNNLIWTLDSDGTLMISGKGSMENVFPAPWYKYRNLITKVVINEGVTSISFDAFSKCYDINAIALPDSIISIGENAFSATEYYRTDSNWEDGILYIGKYCIEAKDSLSGTCAIKDGTICIASSAFSGCAGLTKITIPESVTSIGNSAFSGCTGLTEITIPESVTSIGNSAFSGCTGLTEITIPESVTIIGDSAFSGCAGLEKVYWNAVDVESTGYCFGDAGNPENGIELIFGDSVKTIPESICRGMNLRSVSIGKNVETIGAYAFFDNSDWLDYNGHIRFTEIVIPDSVTTIGDSAFSDCKELNSISIGNGVTAIGNSAFSRCTSLTEITIPGSVTTIGDSAFSDCKELNSISIGNGVTAIGNSAFSRCTSLTEIIIPDSVTTIGSSAFFGCTGLTDIAIPDSVTSIGNYAFYGCSGLSSVTCSNSIATIPQYAFASCTSLESIVLPESVSYVAVNAFLNSGLKDIEIRNSRCVIEYDAATIPVGAVIHGYVNSPAQLYAQMYARGFVPFENTDCAHTYSAWTVDAEATCTERGLSHRSCLLCGDVDIAVTPATGHTDENGDDLCDTCGASLAANVPGGDDTPCVTHTYSDWVINAEATCTERGLSHRTCRKCGDLEISIIPATGHTDENGDDLCDTCGAFLAPEEPGEDEPTENGLMKIMQKIVDFFSRLAAWLKSMFAKTA